MEGLGIVAVEEATYLVIGDIVVGDRLGSVVGDGSIYLLVIQLMTTATTTPVRF